MAKAAVSPGAGSAAAATAIPAPPSARTTVAAVTVRGNRRSPGVRALAIVVLLIRAGKALVGGIEANVDEVVAGTDR